MSTDSLLEFALGPEQLFYVKLESAFDTYTDWAASDMMHILKSDFSPIQGRMDRADSRKTRSLLERINKRKETSWSIESYLNGGASPGVAPDIAPFIEAAMGTQTVVPSTSVSWTEARTQCPTTLQMGRSTEVGAQHINGASVKGFEVDISGGLVNFKANGEAVWQIFNNSVEVTGSIGDAYVDALDSDSAQQVDINSKVVVEGSAADDGPFTVTNVVGTRIFLDGVLTATHGAGILLKPWRPTPSTIGSPATDLVGFVTLDSGELDLFSFKLAFTNNTITHNKQVGTDRATYAYHKRRAVTGVFGVHYRRDMGKWYDFARQLTQSANLQVRVGSNAAGGDRWTFALTQIEIDMHKIEIPQTDGDVGTMNIPWVAKGSTGEDDLVITLD